MPVTGASSVTTLWRTSTVPPATVMVPTGCAPRRLSGCMQERRTATPRLSVREGHRPYHPSIGEASNDERHGPGGTLDGLHRRHLSPVKIHGDAPHRPRHQ